MQRAFPFLYLAKGFLRSRKRLVGIAKVAGLNDIDAILCREKCFFLIFLHVCFLMFGFSPSSLKMLAKDARLSKVSVLPDGSIAKGLLLFQV